MFQIFRDTRALSFGAVVQTPGLDFKKGVSWRGGPAFGTNQGGRAQRGQHAATIHVKD
jgi:hypothetical protein